MRQSVIVLAVTATALLVRAEDTEEENAPVDETVAPTPEPEEPTTTPTPPEPETTPLPPGATPQPTVATPMPPTEVTKYCDEDVEGLQGRCGENGRCNQETFACECSEGFGAKKGSDGEWSYAGCYEEERETNAVLIFEQGKCNDDGEVDPQALAAMLDSVKEVTEGEVKTFTGVCASINLIVTLGVPATKAKALEVEGFSLSTAVATKLGEKVEADPQVKAAIQATLGDQLTATTSGVEVAPSQLPPPVARAGETPVPTTPAPTTKSLVPECDGVANAKVAREIAGVCSAMQCNEGYVKKEQAGVKKGAICEVAPTNPEDLTCKYNGDCPANLECVSEKCVTPAPVSTKGAEKVEVAFELNTETCNTNEDCRVNGDAGATCDTANMVCACSTGYMEVSNTLRTCVAKEATTVRLNLRMVFGEGDCQDYSPTAQDETKSILKELLSGEVDGFSYSCGSTVVVASVSAGLEATKALVGTSFSAEFNKKLAASSGNAELKKQGTVTTASLFTYSECETAYATQAVRDTKANCQALVCVEGGKVLKNGDMSVCEYTMPRVNTDSDDDLTDSEWAGIAIGIVLFVVVVAAIVFFFLRSSGPEQVEQVQKETEPVTV